ncbi:MAG: hypothetical protein JSU61_01820 [Fidelibacterota bacterium]|nr:MAG: hypothetical protein JSU61_01820 [Candidatus Neomarinimicrobiota bacterium]
MPIARLILLSLIPLVLNAQAKYAGELFELPGDARSVAMGGTGVSSTHQAATGFFNPALVAQPILPSLMLAHREQFGGVVSADLAAISFGHSSTLAFQLGLLRRGVDDIPDTRKALDDHDGDGELDDDERLLLDKIGSFNQREWGILLSMARRDQIGWQWGASVKLLGHWLADELGLGMGFDLGVWRELGHALSLGLMIQDITTTQVYWSTGRWATTAPRITSGIRGDFILPLVRRRVAIEGELTTRLDGRRLEQSFGLGQLSFLHRLGLELALNENLRIRAGTTTVYPFSLGVGLGFSSFAVDYAYINDTSAQVFEPTHQITLTLYLEALRAFLGNQ